MRTSIPRRSMRAPSPRLRSWALWLAFILCTALALPALGQDDEDLEDEEEESAWAEYGSAVRNRSLMGVNSLATFPADPVMSTVEPRDEFDDLPVAVVTKRFVGFIQGVLLGTFRACAGTLDVLFSPLTPMKMLSPEPRYMLFDDVEHEEF